MKNIGRVALLTGICVIASAALVAPAVAQSPAAEGYDETGLSTLPPLSGPPASPDSPWGGPPASPQTPAGPSGEDEALAFTGLDLPLMALLGGMLLAAGMLLRGRRRTPAS